MAGYYIPLVATPQIGGGGGGGGSDSGVLLGNMNNDTNALDKTWQEIHDAANSGSVVMMKQTNADGLFFYYLSEATQGSTDYSVAFYLSLGTGDALQGWTNSASGYPVMDN